MKSRFASRMLKCTFETRGTVTAKQMFLSPQDRSSIRLVKWLKAPIELVFPLSKLIYLRTEIVREVEQSKERQENKMPLRT